MILVMQTILSANDLVPTSYHFEGGRDADDGRRNRVAWADGIWKIKPFAYGKNSSPVHGLPIVVEIVDSEEKVKAFLPVLDEIMGGGSVTLERAKIVRYQDQEKR